MLILSLFPLFVNRVFSSSYLYILNGKIEARTPRIITGSDIWEGTGTDYVVLFTLSGLCEMFGVSTNQAADFTVYAMNGDGGAFGYIPRGAVYNPSGKNWLFYNSSNIQAGKKLRVNYAVFYNPESTVG